MAERQNGKSSFTRRTHGSERRGVFSVPKFNYYVAKQEQSARDKARLFEKIRERNERLAEKSDLGNKELPAYRHKQEILANVESYKAVILGGATGSGKSTQVPQYLYEAGYEKTYVLVPRRVIADGLGERIREEVGSQLPDVDPDKLVGIVHGERAELDDEENRIVVMTPNTYNRMEASIREKYGDKKVAIISDEIHEANLYTEIATGVAAMSVRDHDQWRLIAASATHNADTLRPSFQELNDGYVPVVTIEGRPFNVELQEASALNTMQAYARLGKDHEKAMIFTSGKREIDHIITETIAELEREEKGSSSTVVFRKLHGELSEVELAHIDDPIPEGYRLVVVASPAGMSGITIPGTTLVVTDGTINRQELDEDGIPGLKRRYLSKAEITQQIGRAGRDVPNGIGILAMPTSILDDAARQRGAQIEAPEMPFLPFEERDEHAPPEIYHSILSRVVLSVASLDKSFSDINPYIPHSVQPSAIINAEESLYRLGALDAFDKITETGRVMDQYPITPELSRGFYELVKNRRPLQQLARAAFIIGALEAGGLQDFSEQNGAHWKRLVRSTTSDDFIAQLDLMIALEDAERAEEPLFGFMDKFDLHPKYVERAQKVSRKVLQTLKISPQNIVVTPPLPDEETQLRNDLTAGMIDLVHQEVGKSFRKVTYRNIHGDESSTKRLISSRSVARPKHGQLVAGFPRWYEKRRRGKEPQRFDIVEMTLLVDPEVVGAYALANNLAVGRPIAPVFNGDRVEEREVLTFGGIQVGKPFTSARREVIPEASQKALVRRSLENPGEAQRALRDIAEEMEWYEQHTPAHILSQYQKHPMPALITKEYIRELITKYASTTRSLSDIDNRLAHHIYSKNITINRFYDDEVRRLLRSASPETIHIDGKDVAVLYELGQPYITNPNEITVFENIYLPDGREVLAQRILPDGSKVRVSFSEF